jgi:hypothetical protein
MAIIKYIILFLMFFGAIGLFIGLWFIIDLALIRG